MADTDITSTVQVEQGAWKGKGACGHHSPRRSSITDKDWYQQKYALDNSLLDCLLSRVEPEDDALTYTTLRFQEVWSEAPFVRPLPVVGATSQGRLRFWTIMITIDPPTDILYRVGYDDPVDTFVASSTYLSNQTICALVTCGYLV